MNNEEIYSRLGTIEGTMNRVLDEMKKMNSKVSKNSNRISHLSLVIAVIAIILMLAIPTVRGIFPVL